MKRNWLGTIRFAIAALVASACVACSDGTTGTGAPADAATESASALAPDGAAEAGSEDATSADAGAGDASADSGSTDTTGVGPIVDAGGTDSTLGAADTGGVGADAASEATVPDGGAGGVYLCGSPPPVASSDGGATTILTMIGHQAPVSAIWRSGDRVLTTTTGDSVLWDVPTGLVVESGGISMGQAVDSAGGLFVTNTVIAGLFVAQVRSFSDATVVGTIPSWVNGLASDGSYVWAASASGLSAWSPAGVALVSHAGNYAGASVFAAPGQLQVALGPAGAQVIETVSIPSGSATTSPTFTGTFDQWFTDGAHFSSFVGADWFIYTPDAARVLFTVLSDTTSKVGGRGNYYWAFEITGLSTGQLTIYSLFGTDAGAPVGVFGGPTIVGTTTLASLDVLVTSGDYLALLSPETSNPVEILHLGASEITDTVYPAPYPLLTAFGADPTGLWAVGNDHGAVAYEGTTTSPSQTGPLGCGAALALTGSASGRAALATASGGVFVFDDASGVLVTHMAMGAGTVALSGDGNTLAAIAVNLLITEVSDSTLNVFDVPSGAVIASFPGQFGTSTQNAGVSLNSSGSRISLARGQDPYERIVTDLVGPTTILDMTLSYAPIFSGAPQSFVPTLSPSGANIAITSEGNLEFDSADITFYDNATPVGVAPGFAIAWLDETHLLAAIYGPPASLQQGGTFSAMAIYDNQGNLVSNPPLPQIQTCSVINASEIYSPFTGDIYTVATGAIVESLGGGTIADSTLVTTNLDALVATPY